MSERSDHLDWCKARAIELVNAGQLAMAVSSMVSDLLKHPETAKSVTETLSTVGLMRAACGDPREVQLWVEGFN